MWPLAGGVLMLGGVLPSALLWLRGRTADASLWQTAAAYNTVDTIFSVTAICLLWIAVKYGNTRGAKKGREKQPAPYPGAWVEPDGHQVVPQGFPFYLALATFITIITPTLILSYCLFGSTDPTLKALGAATLAPYLLVFLPQILLETKFLNRSFMTPALPVLYAYYRFWQFIRSLNLVAHVGAAEGGIGSAGSANPAKGAAEVAGQYSWLVYYLISLLCFWVFDTGCTMVWLPGMYEWQLQDIALLTRLSKQREGGHMRHKAAPAGVGARAEGDEALTGPALAAKLRHRWRLAGSKRVAGSGDYDSYT